MKEIRDGSQANRMSKSASSDSNPLVLDVDDFKVMSQSSFRVENNPNLI